MYFLGFFLNAKTEAFEHALVWRGYEDENEYCGEKILNLIFALFFQTCSLQAGSTRHRLFPFSTVSMLMIINTDAIFSLLM